MGKEFFAFSLILTIAILLAIFLKGGIFKSTFLLISVVMGLFAYYLLDTIAIVHGMYGYIGPDNYVLGSAKLFLDFAAFFMAIIMIFKGDN